MTIRDALNTFSNGQAVTAAAASTSEVNLKAVYDPGLGKQMYIVACCTVAMEGSSVTNVITLRQSTATGMGSPDTLATVCTFPATSAAGTKYVYAIPASLVTKQFLDVYHTPTGGAGSLSAGSFDVFITTDPNVIKQYADGIDYSLAAS